MPRSEVRCQSSCLYRIRRSKCVADFFSMMFLLNMISEIFSLDNLQCQVFLHSFHQVMNIAWQRYRSGDHQLLPSGNSFISSLLPLSPPFYSAPPPFLLPASLLPPRPPFLMAIQSILDYQMHLLRFHLFSLYIARHLHSFIMRQRPLIRTKSCRTKGEAS